MVSEVEVESELREGRQTGGRCRECLEMRLAREAEAVLGGPAVQNNIIHTFRQVSQSFF